MQEVYARKVVSILKQNGYKAYFAGGCVRDLILGFPTKDYDIATNATPDIVRKLFRKTVPVGIQFGVVLVLLGGYQYEVTTFRRDGKYLDGRHPSNVIFSDEKDDVQRRDFTINGLLYDPDAETILDYVSGKEDLKNKLIRAIGNPYDRFNEDKLRILRAIRFSTRFGYAIEELTFKAILDLQHEIVVVSKERIKDELLKIFSENNISRATNYLIITGLLSTIIRKFEFLEKKESNNIDKLLEKLTGCEKFLNHNALFNLLYALHVLFTSEYEFNHSSNEKELEDIISIFIKYKFSNKEMRYVSYIIEGLHQLYSASKLEICLIKRIIREPHIDDLLNFLYADSLINDELVKEYIYTKTLTQDYKSKPVETLFPIPLIKGDDLFKLGIKQGPIFKEIITEIENLQLSEKILLKDDAIKYIKKKWLL